jgi:DNA polymerase
MASSASTYGYWAVGGIVGLESVGLPLPGEMVLEKEIQLVQPSLIVALGSTAALALAGKAVSITKSRGPTEFEGHADFITVHPSYLLRIPDTDAKHEAYAAFVADLKAARTFAASLRSA